MRIATPALWLPLRDAGFRLGKLRESWLYDMLMRLPIVAWAAVIVLASAQSLQHYLQTAEPTLPMIVYAINIAMRLSTIAFCAMIAAVVVLRCQPGAKARGIEPRLSALFGTFLASALVFFPRRELPVAVEIASILFVVAGNTVATIVLVQLGRSFSIMAEARRLVTSGFYGLVRHPLYLAEELAVIGVLIQFLSGWTLLLCAAQMAFQLRRIRNEECMLSGAFPEYTGYCLNTARLLPGIY